MALLANRTLSVSIAASAQAVYEFITSAENLPQWAKGFALAVTKSGDDWLVETADGPMRVEFAPRNNFGVADHSVTVRPDFTINNPIRVLPNGEGAEVLFTLFQSEGMTDEQFA